MNQTKVITYFYNNGILLGIFAKDSFTPKTDIVGYTGSIEPGFNAGTLPGIKFNVTCTNAEQLGGTPATTYVRSDTSNAINGQLRITTDLGIVVGSAGQMSLYVTAGDIYMSNSSTDKSLILNVRKGITQENAIAINAANRVVSLYDGYIDSVTNVGGDLIVTGNLTVEGSTTTLNTTELIVEDKNIVIASADSPTNTTADGAGITIKGTTDKTVLYSESDNWLDISETVNLASGKAIYIGGTLVIDGTSLGSTITSIPGVTSFGTQTVINIGPGIPAIPQLRLEEHRISTVSNNYDIELYPDGTGNIVLNDTARITNIANPINQQDASTKEYVDNVVETRSLVFSTDLSDAKSNTYIINNILNNLAPPGEFRSGTIARILCTINTNSTTTFNINSLPPTVNTSQFLTSMSGDTSLAVIGLSFPSATLSAPILSTTRIIKEFSLNIGVWLWQSDTLLPP